MKDVDGAHPRSGPGEPERLQLKMRSMPGGAAGPTTPQRTPSGVTLPAVVRRLR